MRKRTGFTLIELLVVITIVAVLVAILVPIIRNTMRDAQRTGCMANLKVIGGAYREWDRAIGGFARIHAVGNPIEALNVAGAPTLGGVSHNAMDQVWGLIHKGYLPINGFHCPADRAWTPRSATNPFGWTAITEFSYGLQFPFDDLDTDGAIVNEAFPGGPNYSPNGLLMADIGNDDTGGTAVVSVASQYTNHADGIAYLHLAGNVNFHDPNPANSVIFTNEIYDDDGTNADDNMPDAPTDAVILPIR